MQANKTPYELRLDVIKMAQEMLAQKTQIEQNKFYAKLETLRADKSHSVNELNKFIDENTPKMYDTSEVVAHSRALYSFVNDTTRNKP